MTAVEQQAILNAALQGDRQSLGTLLESLRPYLRLLVRSRRAGQAAARLDDSDLVQDALLEVHRSFPHFQGTTVAELVAWLRPVVLRSAGRGLREHLGTAQRAVQREVAVADLDALADSGSSPSAQAVHREEAAALARALALLPDDMQQVLIGRHADQLPYASLAEQMGRTELAVRALYTRALRRLRALCGTENAAEREST